MLTLVPLGDQAALATFADEAAALAFAKALRPARPPWMVDAVQAYATVAVYFDLERTHFAEVAAWLRGVETHSCPDSWNAGRLHTIPCCYELGPDLERVAEHTGLAIQEVIARHTQSVYTVFAIGFCPGFPYLGYLPGELCGVPRLLSPRVRVEAGSVGLTGRQTGIYTEARPGGWNLVGRTPLQLVDVAAGYFPLRTGDRVQFRQIDRAEFQRRQGERLNPEPVQ